MYLIHTKKNNLPRSLIATVCMFLVLTSSFVIPKESQAQSVTPEPVIVIGDTSGNLVANVATAANTAVSATSNTALQLKELTLDGIAWAIARKLSQHMTRSIVTWINSGFQGSPAFVTNLDRFLLGVADEVAGDFIYDTDLGFLCEPIEFPVRVALEIQYLRAGRDDYEPKCTLSGVVGNIEDFLEGNFSAGGWPAFFELTVGSHNDPNKAFFSASAELESRIGEKQTEEVKLLEFGNGLFSMKICDSTTDSNGRVRENCEIGTPGTVIERALTFEVGEKGSLALIEADEFNEILSALMSQLVTQALSGSNGLLGLGGNSRYSNNTFGSLGDQSFLEALAEEDVTQDQVIGYNPVTEAIKNEEEFLSIQESILSAIKVVDDKIEEGEEKYPSCFDLELDPALAAIKKDATANAAVTKETLATLNTVNEILISTTDGRSRLNVLNVYTKLESEGALTTKADNYELRMVFLEKDLPEIIEPFEDYVDNELKRCEFDATH